MEENDDIRTGICEEIGVGGGGGGGVLLGIRGEGVPPGSPNPDPISEQNMSVSIPIFRPGL